MMTTVATSRQRVAIYARVSTTRQAEADLSIPDQIRHAEVWCHQHGKDLVSRYVEPGASGTDESRPVFQKMLAAARQKPRPFDVVLVHSYSRFCRDELTYAATKRDPVRAGTALRSMAQPLGDDHTGQMVASILVTFDACQSRENGKHTARAMKENARQGFWNGSHPPFGYETMDAGRRGEKLKKALAVHQPEADVARRIYAMYLGIEGRQFGVKAAAAQLNAEGVSYRGKPLAISNVHRILTHETYAGTHWFNVRDSKTGRTRPRSEWVALVLDQLADRVFRPDRLNELLSGFLDQSQTAEQERQRRLSRLKAELTEVEGGMQRLLTAVEKGLLDLDDPALAERLRLQKLQRIRLNEEIACAAVNTGPAHLSVTAAKLDRLSGEMREALKTGPAELRRAYVRMFIHRVSVSRREIHISGPNAALARAAASDGPAPPAQVLSFVREWRPVRGSNPCYRLERAMS